MKITEMIRYWIVHGTGIREKAPILRLLKKENLNLDKTLNICRSHEAAIATKQLDSMKQVQTQTDEQVNVVGTDQAKRTNKRRAEKAQWT